MVTRILSAASAVPLILCFAAAESPSKAPAPTYSNKVAHILAKRCVDCHRKGGSAPFALESFQDVNSKASVIEAAVRSGKMPPWFAAPPEAGKPSPWANDRSLGAEEKASLLNWLGGKRPLGDPKEAPQPRAFDAVWQIGKPDAVYQYTQPVNIPADGVVPYVIRTVETGLTEDKWVSAIEIRPSARSVVHHVLVFIQEAGDAARRGRGTEEAVNFFGAYVPGNSTLVYADGLAKKLPKGAVLRFQLHYTPTGKAAVDQTQIAVRFAAKPPKHEVLVAGIVNPFIRIPPGAENHPEKAVIPVPVDVKILAFMPHMHLRSKSCKYTLVGADGARETLLDVPKYDFNWQLYYLLKEPKTALAGSRVEFDGVYDNSSKNPANPDPTKTVRWGQQTFEEMLLGYIEYYSDTPAGEALARPRAGGAFISAAFTRLDANKDGKVTKEELGARWDALKAADTNGDGAITLEEARAYFRSR